MSDISRDLKILAKELNLPVIALSQLSRDVESQRPPVPQLSHLRDSGALEQDADLVLLIYRGDLYEPNTTEGFAQLLVAKQRNGPTGRVFMAFHRTCARFEELADQRTRPEYPGLRPGDLPRGSAAGTEGGELPPGHRPGVQRHADPARRLR